MARRKRICSGGPEQPVVPPGLAASTKTSSRQHAGVPT